ncbi:hypothetical protein D0Y65_025408 [Glycine soja]|uniref:Uncharacterized protein n=1 Tax=Glycine soja TaxID=3848 RepID=A0A445J6Y6_GLYSO|nr:hypothetical protein D0Y65_025408 [Glycine soja]
MFQSTTLINLDSITTIALPNLTLEAPIPNGDILAEEIKGLNLTLTVMADRLVSNSKVTKDVALGSLPLNTLVRIFSQVNVLGFIKFYVASTSSCDFTLNLSYRTIVNKKCQEKTDFLVDLFGLEKGEKIQRKEIDVRKERAYWISIYFPSTSTY